MNIVSRFGILFVSALVLLSLSCGGGGARKLMRVEIYFDGQATDSVTTNAGTQMQFTAKAFDSNGVEVTGDAAFIWSMNSAYAAADVGTISADGLFTAGATAGNYFQAIKLSGSSDGATDLDEVSLIIN